MTVTVEDVIDLLGGVALVPPTGYSIFGHSITTTSIEAQIELATAYYDSDFFSETVLRDKATKVDFVIKLDVAATILAGQVMGTLMKSGFTYSTLQLTVNKGDFPEKVANAALNFAKQRDRFMAQLSDSIDYNYDVDDLGDFSDGLTLLPSDYPSF